MQEVKFDTINKHQTLDQFFKEKLKQKTEEKN